MYCENRMEVTPLRRSERGQMYVNDGRFTKNIDRFGGLQQDSCDAMAVYADNNK